MKRIILGTRGAEVGMWISAPGKDANSTTSEDLLVSTSYGNMRPILTGQISSAVLAYDDAQSVKPYIVSYSTYGSSYIVNWSSGYAYYYMDVTHGLGYRPVCHVAIENTDPGSPSPRILVTTSKLTLFLKQTWNVKSGIGGDLILPSMPSSVTVNKAFNYTLFQDTM